MRRFGAWFCPVRPPWRASSSRLRRRSTRPARSRRCRCSRQARCCAKATNRIPSRSRRSCACCSRRRSVAESVPVAKRRIAVIAGDGIGPEVITEALLVLEQLRRARGVDLEVWELPLGAELYLREGTTFPLELRQEVRASC